jgi:peptidoglycan pentaglycine glycine transferase (the second and third glycine)
MFYSPRGFLIDYKNYDLLKEFTEEIKKYAKEHGAIFIKIDPYLEHLEHDNEGNVVEGGFNNKDAVDNLIKLGYKHYGFNLMQDTLQPRWMHVINTDRSLDDVMKDMESKTRQILRKNEKCGITTREITRDELPLFKDIMQHTSDRREFVDRLLS